MFIKLLKDIKKNGELILLILPGVLFIFVFNYIPLYGLVLPFKDYKFNLGFFGSPWVGLKNFKFLLNSDSLYLITRNTIGFNALFIIFGTIVSIFFAILLFELTSKYVKIYQTILFFPYFVSWVVASYLALSLLDMEYGFINKVIGLFGGDPVLWYNEPKYWIVILILSSIWKGTGYGAVLYYTVLMSIDSEMFEAARMDGANKLQQIWNISIPSLKPLVIMLTIMSIGRIFYGDFGLFYNVTLNSTFLYPVTDIIDTYVYRALRQLGDLGMSAAAGFYQSTCGFLLVLLTNIIIKKFSPEDSLF